MDQEWGRGPSVLTKHLDRLQIRHQECILVMNNNLQ